MHTTFEDVVLVVCAVATVIALLALAGSGRTWSEYGRHALLMDAEEPAGDAGAPAGRLVPGEEANEEIRQLLEARNARRARRGEPPLDVEAELARLTATGPPAAAGLDTRMAAAPAATVDPALVQEIRQLVIARNHRRARRGQPPLDVEAEVASQLSRLTAGELT